MFNLFIIFFLCFVSFDTILQNKTNLKGIYYLLHFIHNMFISYFTFTNVVNSFYPELQGGGSLHPNVLSLIYSLHCYHIISYQSYLRLDDWLHHILSMGVAVPLTLYLFPSRNLLGFSFFFTTGIPGGINYLNLFLYKNGWMTKQKQQQLNVSLQSWIRCPGIIMNCAFILQFLILSNYSFWMNYIGVITFSILYWNGIYFQNLVMNSFFLNLNK